MSDDRLRLLGALAGVAGPVLLVIYFGTPAVTGWPYGGASPDKLLRYADSHSLLFYAGGWLQATGALLSVVFFMVLLRLSGTAARLSGIAAIVGCALLLSVVQAIWILTAAVALGLPLRRARKDASTR